jgi:beta-N-acetylhexosaminidase
LHEEVMVAFDREAGGRRRQVGWTFMLSPRKSSLWDGFVFLAVAGGGGDGVSGQGKTALIAAVGVSEDARGKGAGLGLVCAAMEELRRRGGVEGVFVDSVVLGGFYERVGFGTWREYREMTLDDEVE